MRTRSLLSLAASAAALLSAAAPAVAADTATYQIQLAGTNHCLAPSEGVIGGALDTCSPDTAWTVRTLDDGTVQFVERNGEGRCLGLSPVRIVPPAVWLSECGSSPDHWRADIRTDSSLAVLVLEGTSFGSLTTAGNRAAAAGDGSAEWLLRPVG